MGGSFFVGRIGALAVALGVGAGIGAGGAGPAWSAPLDAGPQNEDAGGAETSSNSDAAASGRTDRVGRPPQRDADRSPRVSTPRRGAERASENRVGRGSRLPQDGTVAAVQPPSAAATQVRSEVEEPNLVLNPPSALAQPATAMAVAGQAPSAIDAIHAAQASPPEALLAVGPVPADQAPQMESDPVAAVNGTVASLLVPLSGVAPGTPVGSTAPWVFLAAARRELDGAPAAETPPAASSSTGQALTPARPPSLGAILKYTFFHKSATADPTQAADQEGGVVTGTLNARTDNGAPLAYSVAQAPAEGNVVIGEDGTYTYTAGAALAAAGGSDSFRVTIDNGTPFRLTGFGGLVQKILRSLTQGVGLSQPDTITVTVPVTVAAAVDGAPVFGEPALTQDIDLTTGVITGRFSAADPEGKSVSFGLSGNVDPGVASFALNASTGEFTFTPTALARFNAALNEQGGTVTIVVSASDGKNTATTNYLATVVPQYLDDDGEFSQADLDTLAQIGAIGASVGDSGLLTTVVGDFTGNKIADADEALLAMNRLAGLLGAPGDFSGDITVQTTDFSIESGGVPQTFYRLSQRVNGVPVHGGEVILTAMQDGTATGVFSSIDPRIYQVDTTPDAGIDESAEVDSAAIRIMLGNRDNVPAGLLDSLVFDRDLVIYSLDPAVIPALAWLVTVRTVDSAPGSTDLPSVGTSYYIYANGSKAGTLLFEETGFAEAAASTGDSVTQSVRGLNGIDYIINFTRGARDELWDQPRNMTVSLVANMNDSPYRSPLYSKEISGAWDQAAVSAMGNMRLAFDYYTDVLGHKDLPNPMKIAVVSNSSYTAFWDGGARYVGLSRELTASLDSAAHEMTHAVIASITDRAGSFYGEDGDALDEAYGDIIANLIEGKSDAGRWLVAEDGGMPFRDMRKMVTGSDEPHAKGTIFGYAAYSMMTDSRTSGVSDETWARIFYSSMKRLPSSATFLLARNAVLASALDQGLNGSQLKAIADAFNAAGIRVEDPRVKVVLRWDDKPADLDAHLTGPSGLGAGAPRFHVYHGAPNYISPDKTNPWPLSASLDYDDSNSYGPESITVKNLSYGDYYFYVHDASNRKATDSTELARSGATVEVFTPDEIEIPATSLFGYLFRYITGQVPTTFRVDGSSPGTLWTVFKLTSAYGKPVITAIDDYSYQSKFAAIGNSQPVISGTPTIAVDPASGRVTGSVTATDPELDRLSYAVTGNPINGRADINPDTGSFNYDADSAAREAAAPTYTTTVAVTGLNKPSRIILGPSGTAYAVNAGDVTVIDTATNTVIDSFATAPYSVGLVETDPTGQRAYFTTFGRNTLGVIIPGSTTVEPFKDFGDKTPTAIGFAPDGKTVYVAATTQDLDGSLVMLDARTGEEIGNSLSGSTVSFEGTATAIAQHPWATIVYMPGIDKAGNAVVRAVNTFSRSITNISGLQAPNDIVVSPDGKRLYVTTNSQSAGTLWVYDTETRTVLADVALTAGLAGYLAISPEGDRVYASTWNPSEGRSAIAVVNTADFTAGRSPAVRIIDLSANAMPYPALSADGTKLYVADKASTVSVIDTKSGAEDSFVVTVTDGRGGSASTSVTVPIVPLITELVGG